MFRSKIGEAEIVVLAHVPSAAVGHNGTDENIPIVWRHT